MSVKVDKPCENPGCKVVMKNVNRNRRFCKDCLYWRQQHVQPQAEPRYKSFATRRSYEEMMKGYNR